VANAIVMKRYIQMNLERNKSDNKDASWICRYAMQQRPPYWEMSDSAYFECKQLYNPVREYTEQTKRFNNQLHSLRLLPVPSKDTIKSLEKSKATIGQGNRLPGAET
jgi:transposase